MQRSDLIDVLLGIDEEASLLLDPSLVKPRVVIVGGAAFMLHDLTPRKVTHDIDIFEADGVVKGILAQYPDVNGSVAAFADQIPYNFEDRLVCLDLGAKTIDFVTPSIEDLIVMKLYAERPSDIQDVDGAVEQEKVDWNVLEQLVLGEDEAAAAALSERRYKEMVEAYERLKERSGR